MGSDVMVLGHLRAPHVAGLAAWRARFARRLRCALPAALLVMGQMAGMAQGQDIGPSQDDGIWGRSRLVDLTMGGLNSDLVRSAAASGFELSGGEAVDLQRWYAPELPNLSATFVTELSPHVGVIWGGALGERGEKYNLGPTATLGVVFRTSITHNLTIEMEMSGIYGGRLRERACIGDFGAVGGVQRVNCRLAASFLPPKETLEYLWDEPARAVGVLRLVLRWTF
jgi:hypothetical protein